MNIISNAKDAYQQGFDSVLEKALPNGSRRKKFYLGAMWGFMATIIAPFDLVSGMHLLAHTICTRPNQGDKEICVVEKDFGNKNIFHIDPRREVGAFADQLGLLWPLPNSNIKPEQHLRP